MSDDSRRSGHLRVSLREQDLEELMRRYPKLARTEIADVISARGPMRREVEEELERLSAAKR